MPSAKVRLISSGAHVLLERLDGRVVAAGLEADGDRHAGEIGGVADRRVRRHEDAGGRDGIDVGVELGVAVGGGDVDGPVAGAADVRLASLLDALEGAFLSPCCGAGPRSSGSARGIRSRALRRGNSPSPRPPIPAGGNAVRSRIWSWGPPGPAAEFFFDGRIANGDQWSMPSRECFTCPKWNLRTSTSATSGCSTR